MGLFSNLFDGAKELTKFGNAAANVKIMLDRYEVDADLTFIYCSAWICKVGILDLIEKNKWMPTHIVYIPINGHQTKMYISEVCGLTVGRLKNKVSNDSKLSRIVANVLEGGNHFYEIDTKIPPELRDATTKI